MNPRLLVLLALPVVGAAALPAVAATVPATGLPPITVQSPTPLHQQSTTSRVAGAVSRVVVRTDSGSLSTRPGSTASVQRTQRWNTARPAYRQSLAGGTLTVTATCPAQHQDVNNCSTDLALVVPAGATLDLETTNGDVTVAGSRSRTTTARTTNGDVSVTLTGSPRTLGLASTNGSVDATVPAGRYRLSTGTTNGDVTLRGVRDDAAAAGAITARTTNGDVSLRGR